MRSLLTLSEMADRFAAARGGSADDAALFLRQLRHLDAQQLIRAVAEPRDKRGTAQFTAKEMFIARLMVAATDHNMTRGDLAWLRTVIEFGRTAVFPGTGSFKINLDANLERIQAGETWMLQLAFARGSSADARTTLSHWIRVLEDGRRNQFGDLYPDPLLPGAALGDGRAIEAVTYINATNLLLPLMVDEG